LDDICAGNQVLRAEFEELLRTYDEADDFLEVAPVDCEVTLEADPMAECPGTVIGPYKLLEKIGEGGMAVVYMAQQTQPLNRRIALKIIKLGMDTKEVIARFEAERQALAVMDHPNIAKVFDAGATETGRPYFVMELVRGGSITEYCDKSKLSTKERLELFIPVCNAIHHAHQKGIIHRDLKPSNIMVTLHDSQPVPKVIDFGIAKATNRQLTDKTVFTRYAQMIGTPEYMSPEQAEMSGLDIDIRTDIYSLGVVLYELLTGALPFDPDTLRSAAFGEIQRIIREQEPPRPSTRLSTLGQEAVAIAAKRDTEPAALVKRLSQELEWIPLRAIRKDRLRRYQSMLELASDVENYLTGDPLLAGPESNFYRCKKFMHRYRTPITVAVGIAAAVIIGLVVSLSLYVRAQRALDALARLEGKVESDQILSRTQRLSSEGRYEAALTELESMLEKRDLGPKAQLLNAQILFQVGRQADAQNALVPLTSEGPEIAGAAHYLLARISIGRDLSKAEEHKRQAEEMLPNTAEAYSLRATAASTPEETLEWLCKALQLNPTHYPSLKARALAYYGSEQYQSMSEDAAVLVALRPRDPQGYAFRAIARRELGQFGKALADHNQALRLCRSVTDRADIYDQRRETYMRAGDYTAALQDARQCVALQPEEFRHQFNVFAAMFWLEDYQQAQEQYRQIVRTSPEWHRLFRSTFQKHVFDVLASGRELQLPADVALKAPFYVVQETMECYDLLAGTATRLVPAHIWPGCWSPDGKQIAYARAPSYHWNSGALLVADGFPAIGSGNGIEILDLESGKKRLLTTFGVLPSWSPDGQTIAFTDKLYPPGAGEVWVIPAAGGQARKIASGYKSCWAPDSRTVFFRARPEGTICSIRVDEANALPVHIMETPGRYPHWFSVSPSGAHIAYEYAHELCVVDLSSQAIVSKWKTPYPLYGWRLVWSPDEKHLVIGSSSWYSQTGTWILDIDKNEARQALPQSGNLLALSPDESRLLVNVLDEIWLADIGSGTPISMAFGPAMTRDQFLSQRLQRWTQRIEANPQDAELYLERALTYIAIQEYKQARVDLQIFTRLVTPSDKHLFYMMCWWGRQYCDYSLFEGGESILISAAELQSKFPETQSDWFRSYRYLPTENLVSIYENWGRPELAEKWRNRLSSDTESK
jgi:serine/threonine protein kinase